MPSLVLRSKEEEFWMMKSTMWRDEPVSLEMAWCRLVSENSCTCTIGFKLIQMEKVMCG